MQILGLLGMYFDAVVEEVKTFLLLFRLALTILCCIKKSVDMRACTYALLCTYFIGENVLCKVMSFQIFFLPDLPRK